MHAFCWLSVIALSSAKAIAAGDQQDVGDAIFSIIFKNIYNKLRMT